MWPRVQDRVAWGLEHNDLKLPRVPRCSSSIIIPYVAAKLKQKP
jgi:hypothetical protein